MADIVHNTFVIEREFRFAPGEVFAAWASKRAKERWFVGPAGWKAQVRELDFRVGGHETLVGQHPSGGTSTFRARFHEIVPDERIVYVYDMYSGDTRTSISLVTIALEPRMGGTHLVITEQGVFLDGHDAPRRREQGTKVLIDQLEGSLQAPAG